MDFFYSPVNYNTTLGELVSEEFSVFGEFKNDLLSLLDYIADGKTNAVRIGEYYDQTPEDLNNIASGNFNQIRILSGTILALPKSKVSMDLLAITGKNLFIKNIASFTAFYGLYLELLKRDGFTPAFRDTSMENDIDIREYNLSVWVWCRANNQDGNILLDVTKYVESCHTNVNGIQNSFSINLQAIDDAGFAVGDEIVDRVDLDKNKNNSVWDFVQPATSVSERLPQPWFKRILQQNDIFFIRFERLTLETSEDRGTMDLIVPISNLRGKVFDMIGLVDQVSHRLNFANLDMSVEVTGRDVTKLLIEDGSYFFPLLFVENSETLFFNTQDDNKLFKRSFVKNTYDYLFLYKMQSVRDSLGFVLNQLTNLGVCDDTLFSSYDNKGDGGLEGAGLGGRRSQSLQITGQRKDTLEWNTVSGIWQIVDLLVDTQIEDRRIANSQIMNPNGNLLSVIESFCQWPFVEFFGDTYGDKFTFIARTPPYTKEAIKSVLYAGPCTADGKGSYIDINLRDVENIDLDWDRTFYTWFEMDPRNMFLGRADSIALAYVPVVYFPEIAETFGNKPLKITDNYISNKAFTGVEGAENRDLFKQKVIEDFLFAIEAFCYLPFTETGTITLKRDRRIKAKTWIKLGAQFFYVESVSNSFVAIGERIDGNTTLNVSRGMYIDYIYGKMVPDLNREIDYWSMIKLSVVRSELMQKLIVYTAEEAAAARALGFVMFDGPVEARVAKNTVKMSFGTDKKAFDFFLQRKFLP